MLFKVVVSVELFGSGSFAPSFAQRSAPSLTKNSPKKLTKLTTVFELTYMFPVKCFFTQVELLPAIVAYFTTVSSVSGRTSACPATRSIVSFACSAVQTWASFARGLACAAI